MALLQLVHVCALANCVESASAAAFVGRQMVVELQCREREHTHTYAAHRSDTATSTAITDADESVIAATLVVQQFQQQECAPCTHTKPCNATHV